MENIILNIKDIINSPSALTREQGEIVYHNIVKSIESGKSVTLDFLEIESLISPFLNVAIGKLYEKFTSEILQERLKIVNLPKGKATTFKLVIDNAKRYYANQERFNSIVEDVIDK